MFDISRETCYVGMKLERLSDHSGYIWKCCNCGMIVSFSDLFCSRCGFILTHRTEEPGVFRYNNFTGELEPVSEEVLGYAKD